ncbi:hypothetical protein Tco_1106042 [Tanacetum coccineum]
MDQDSSHMVAASKVPILKPENGNAPPITKVVEGVEITIAPATVEEKAQRSTSSTNEAVNTIHGATTTSTQATAVNSTTINSLSDAVIYAFFASQPNNPQLDNEDLQQIYPDDLEEMDLRWQMAMLTMRARRFLKTLEGSFLVNGTETIGFILEEFVNEPIVKKPVVETSEAKTSKAKPKVVRKNNGALIIKDWVSDS